MKEKVKTLVKKYKELPKEQKRCIECGLIGLGIGVIVGALIKR